MRQGTSGQEHPLLVLLRERGLTQAEFAGMIDYDVFHLNRIIKGHRRGGRKFWRACSRALGLTDQGLFHDDTTAAAA